MKPVRIVWIIRAFKFAILILIVVAAGGQSVMQLWNWLMPELFKLPRVTFWQAFGLLMLARILFGGWGSLGGHGMHGRRMTPEQRERFRRGIRVDCAGRGSAAEKAS